MPFFTAFAFTQSWLLLALAGLPVLWLLLRITPPAPRAMRFPAITFLFGLHPREETPARTPLWLIVLRMLIAALIIVGLARPVFNPTADLSGSGPLVLVIDDGWAAARHWAEREAVLDDLLVQAQREGRSVILLSTAPNALGQPPAATNLLTAAEARRLARGLQPKPWPIDRAAALAAVDRLAISGSAHVVWLSDGLDDGNATSLADKLQRLGRLDVLDDGANGSARLLLPPEADGNGLIVRLRRPGRAGGDIATILARSEDGGLIARAPLTFAPEEEIATARIDLPIELRNRIARLSVEGEPSAGAVLLLDERWRRRPVGLIAAGPLEDAQPLLSELYYLQRALEPFTELRRGAVDELLQRELAILVLPDAAPLREQDHVKVRAWVDRGGLLLRFAGPRLAEAGAQPAADDPLLPVRLRGGGRSLSGVLTWDEPARLAPFPDNRPLAGLDLPGDVLIQRQVLAEPTFDLGEKTWARLSDGTPLVTAARRGDGWVVLVHTTANNDWSNLPLSGLFVEMLRRIVAVSQGVTTDSQAETALPPIETLDGFGRLGPPAPTALALDNTAHEAGRVTPRNPPGYYGAAGLRRAHNLASADPALAPIGGLPSGVNRASYSRERELDLKPWLLSAALLLILLDLGIALFMRGIL
ncbi:MAG: BatA domain-containing protein, partial [Alphaproteobacteria bacterium]